MAYKPRTRLHEVYNPTYGYVCFAGSQSNCLRYVSRKNDPKLIVRPATR